MPTDDITMEFDSGEDDDITTGDILEALKNIKEDTAKMAYLAEKKANETPMDKNIQTQANQKSRLEETDKYQNQNQNQPLSQGVGDGLIGNSTDSTIFAKSPHQQVLDALHEINYSILGLGGSIDRGVHKEGEKPTSAEIVETQGKSARSRTSEPLEITDGKEHERQYVDAEVVSEEEIEGGEEKSKKNKQKRPYTSPFKNRGTDFVNQKTSKLQGHYNRFKQWYTNGMSDDEIKAAMNPASDSYDPVLGKMGMMEGLFEKALPFLGAAGAMIGAVGGAVDWGRHMRQDEISQGVGLGGAIGNTLTDAATNIGHDLGFTANTGRDLQQYRNEALANNWALYGSKATTYFDARKWATNEGLTTQADTNWIQEMTALGLSTNQIKVQFQGLSEVSKQVGVSFQNLSKSVAQEATESEKLFGKQGSQGTGQGEVQVQEADNLFGLNSGTIGKMALTAGGQSAMANVLIASGHAGQEEASVGSPKEMYANIVKDHLGAALAKSMMAQAYQTAISTTYSSNPEQNRQDQEEAFVRNLSSYYGISASDFKNSGMTAFKQMGNGSLSASSTYAGSLTKAGMAQAEKEIPTIKTNIEIGLSKGMEAKIANSNSMTQGLFETEGTNSYFHIQNKWAMDR